MISSLHGVVLHATSDQVVIDVGGVGFAVAVPADVAHTAVVGEKLLLHTSLIVREDSLSLFGFADRGELEIFGLLISVTGVGPKSALGVLSHLTADQIAEAVTAEDDAPFRRVSASAPRRPSSSSCSSPERCRPSRRRRSRRPRAEPTS